MGAKLAFAAVLNLAILVAAVNAAQGGNDEATKEPPDSKVHVIEYENFWRFLKRNELILMEFYAPWW